MKNKWNVFRSLVRQVVVIAFRGTPAYFLWISFLFLLMLGGGIAYGVQLEEGLAATGMNDSISWGLYISNFTFLIGIAAAALMLVLPTYVLKDIDFSKAVLVGEGLAVAALIMALTFVTVDLGGPAKAWHLIPFIGDLNFPHSMLAWDVLVVSGYLFLSLTIPLYILGKHYQGKEPKKNVYFPAILISIFWAVSIHLVTAFLYSGFPSRPFWNSSLLGPRFLASAFTGGTALMIIVLQMIRRYSTYPVEEKMIKKIALITTVAAQINLIMLLSELFKEFYFPSHHGLSAQYLYFGLDGKASLVPWIWSAIAMNVFATIVLSLHTFRQQTKWLNLACIFLFVGIWIEKGMGLIVPGFIPDAWGKVVEYSPSWVEVLLTLAIWGLGLFIFTLLIRPALLIETGKLRYSPK